jgi:hypothetical protein
LNFHSTIKRNRKENFEPSKENSRLSRELKLIFTPFNVIIISLIALGSIALIQVFNVIWKDIVVWEKDINLIFFGSRAGENISLGMGLQIIHYYLLGITCIFSAILLFFLQKWKTKKI